jgi:uncharacterized protein (TIGR04255 family)
MALPIKSKKIPTKLTPCPIFDTTTEIRFTPSSIPAGAIFGMLYTAIQEEFKEEYEWNVNELPILQIPESVRNSDPNLVNQPHYRIESNSFVIQIGPKVLSVGYVMSYPGWSNYIKIIERVFKKARIATGAIDRIGLRYINFFPDVDIFDKLEYAKAGEISLLAGNSSILRTEIRQNGLLHALQISNSGNAVVNNVLKNGSFIDLDISTFETIHAFFDNIPNYLNKLHDAEKEILFGLLQQDYLDTFNPEYGN